MVRAASAAAHLVVVWVRVVEVEWVSVVGPRVGPQVGPQVGVETVRKLFCRNLT